MKKKGEARFRSTDHVLVDREGNMWVGRVLNKDFKIRTLGRTLTFKTKLIWSIIYKNKPYFPMDEMRFTKGMVLQGPVTTTPISFKTAGQVIDFKSKDVLAIEFGYAAGRRS